MATGTSSASAAARLRRTFKYPIDEDDGTDFSPDEMDEEGMYLLRWISLHVLMIAPFGFCCAEGRGEMNMESRVLCLPT